MPPPRSQHCAPNWPSTIAELATAHLLIEQYKAQLHKLRRIRFGRSSEALDARIEQLELRFEDLEEAEATRQAAVPCLNICRASISPASVASSRPMRTPYEALVRQVPPRCPMTPKIIFKDFTSY